MTINDLLVLSALTRGQMHGYALIKRTGISAPTMYRTLKRLRSAGFIGGAEPESRRRPVWLTPRGMHVCTEMLNHIADMLNGECDSLRGAA